MGLTQTLVAVFSASILWSAPSLSRLPLVFEPATAGSDFLAQAAGQRVAISPTGANVGQGWMRLVGARRNAPAHAEDLQPGYSNYLVDQDPRKWRIRVPNYRRLRYHNVYPGIDVVYYGNPRELEFDFIVAPGADPRRIELALSSPDLQIRLPRVYQGDRQVRGRAIRHGNRVRFAVANYDRSASLVIDPVLSYAAVFGGGGFDEGRTIRVDSTGAAYVIGNAFGGNFPVVNGQSGKFSFLARLSPAGDALVYSTYLPWSGGGPSSYAVDASGSAYMTRDGAPGLPLIGPAPLGECSSPPDVYVAKLSSDGASYLYSGCLGGRNPDSPSAIAVDSAGSAYVTGFTQSPDFPLLNPIQSSHPDSPVIYEGFVFKLGPDGTLIYSTFLGGGSIDIPHAIAVDAKGNAYITGQTSSPNFPLKNAIQTELKGPPSTLTGFAAKINADGSELVYSTYLGGSNGDSGVAIAADGLGNTFVAGSTTSGDFPTTAKALQGRFNGIFLSKSSDGAANWSRSDSGLPGGASSLQIDPADPANVYAVSAGQLFKSTDHGASWQAAGAPAASRVWLNPVDSSLFIVTPKADLLRSRDAGATFSTINMGFSGGILNELVFDPKNAAVIYTRWGGGYDGVYKSTDGGDTWMPTGLKGSGTGSGGLALDPVQPSTLYASSRHEGLKRSNDGGDTWTVIDPSITPYQLLVDSASTLYAVSNGVILVRSGDAFVKKAAPASVGTLIIDSNNNATWYVTTYSSSGSGIYKTVDRGDTWQPVANGLPNPPPVSSLALDPSSSATLYLGMYAVPDGFFAKLSSDGASLQYSTYLGGSGTDTVTAIAVDDAGNAYLAGTSDSAEFPLQAPFRTGAGGFVAKFDANSALVWSSSLGGGTPRAVTLGPANELYLTGGSASATFATPGALQQYVPGNFFQSGDGGANWAGTTLATPLGAITAVALDPNIQSRVYALADRVYASDDGGQSWTQLGSIGYPMTRLIVDPQTPSNMYASGTGGFWKSTDGGSTWASIPLVPGVPMGPVSALEIDPQNPGTLYAAALFPVTILPPNASPVGIMKSTDSGATWKATGSPAYATAFAVDPQNSTVLYGSFAGGADPDYFSQSSDGGATWTTISRGLPLANRLIVDPVTAGRIYALGSFPNYGAYRSDDGGRNWSMIGSGLPAGQINTLAIDPGDASVLYAGPAAGGLYRSSDAGANWALVPGLKLPIVNAIAINPSNSSRIYTGAQADPQDVFVMKIVQ